jgi:hypothetical protein
MSLPSPNLRLIQALQPGWSRTSDLRRPVLYDRPLAPLDCRRLRSQHALTARRERGRSREERRV